MPIYCLVCNNYSGTHQRAVSVHAFYNHGIRAKEYQSLYLGKSQKYCLDCRTPTKYGRGGNYANRCNHCHKIYATRIMQNSPEARQKMSLAKLGKPSPRKGMTMSPESCVKMSSSHTLRLETHGVPLNMSYKGKYHPKNVHKYKGDFQNVVFRSLWERSIMSYLDNEPQVLEWSSEEIIVPYFDPIRGRQRRYFPDFWIKVRKPDGTIKEYMWEVKPSRFAIAPTPKTSKEIKAEPKSKRKRYITEVLAYGTNEAKWEAATAYCEARGWKFQVVTEKELPFIGKKNVH